MDTDTARVTGVNFTAAVEILARNALAWVVDAQQFRIERDLDLSATAPAKC
jgi:hypothetical protein